MNHQPFEDWLLDDIQITKQQDRDLQAHLRDCTACTAIAASNLALRSGRMAAPSPGFSDRFRPRLAAWRREQLRRQAFGTIVLVLAGMALLYAVAGPAILAAFRSPAAWLRDVTAQLVALLTVTSVLRQVGDTLVRSLGGLLPRGIVWGMLISAAAAGVLWISTMRRLARAPRGV